MIIKPVRQAPLLEGHVKAQMPAGAELTEVGSGVGKSVLQVGQPQQAVAGLDEQAPICPYVNDLTCGCDVVAALVGLCPPDDQLAAAMVGERAGVGV